MKDKHNSYRMFCESELDFSSLLFKVVKQPFSEEDILDLNDTFLTNGTHYLKIDDLSEGRNIIYLFLSSFKFYYQRIGCLTLSDKPLDATISNIFFDLQHTGYISSIEDYFINDFQFDFCWIEYIQEMSNLPWFIEFYCFLKEISHVPVIFISYDHY